MAETIVEVQKLINARYDLIYISTFEEIRFIDELKSICKNTEYEIAYWSFASGLFLSGNLDDSLKEDPISILKSIAEEQDRKIIYVLKDYHVFLSDAHVTRMLKDTIQKMKFNYTPIIITAPIIKIPIELEKDITIVDYSLPESEEIQLIIKEALAAFNDTEVVEIEDELLNNCINACLGLTRSEIQNTIARSLSSLGTVDPRILLNEKKQIIKKSGILEYVESKEYMKNIGGISKLKNWLTKRSTAFSIEAKEFGLPEPRGLILTGVPGCGKSECCKAVSNLWNMPLLKLDVGSVMNGLVGSSEENMRKVLAVSESVSPCILWLDEMEKALSGSNSSGFSDGGTTSRVMQYFLSWLQDHEKPVFVIATSNDLSKLPPELLRKGRFDDLFFIDLPTEEERKEIFAIHLEKRNRDSENFSLSELSRLTDGFSGAEIEQVIIDAMYEAFARDSGSQDITMFDLKKAILETIPLSKTKSKQIADMRNHAKEVARPAN